ncbi:MAG: FtsX-like permease family protein [Thermoanaerobaculia bacterium]
MTDGPLSWHLALRFLRGRGSRLLGGTARAAFAASALGVAAMGVGMALMTGYQEDLEAKLVGGNAAILVYPPGDLSAPEKEGRDEMALRLAKLPGVTRVEPVQYVQGVITSPAGEFEITLRGADSGQGLVAAPLSDLAAGADGVHGVALGADLAERLGVRPGDELRLVVVAMGERGPKFVYRTVRMRSTFASGFAEFDQAWGVASREFVRELAPDGVVSLEVALAAGELGRAAEIARTIRGSVPEGTLVTDWHELNRDLFAALRLQQIALFLLLGLIVLVSTFNVASTLVVLVRERLRDLGVLAAIGLSPRRMRRVFLLYGGALGLAGVVAGLAAAFVIAWAATRFELVRFGPEVASIYFLRSVPFRLSAADAGAIAAFTLGVTFLSCWFPSRRALRLDPATALRYE